MYLSTFTVKGYGSFPIDMLRQLSCYPATLADSELIRGDGWRSVTLRTRCASAREAAAAALPAHWVGYWRLDGDPRVSTL